MELLTNPDAWIALLTLTILEIVLGIDNIVFISILAGRLPENLQHKARQTGLSLALITRILLLISIAYIAKLEGQLFEVPKVFFMDHSHPVSGRDLILLAGGLFLLWKSTHEIHQKLEGDEEAENAGGKPATFKAVIIQILILDVVFSLDSVITAVGMVKHVPVMIAAVILAMVFMLYFNHAISDFIHRHPTVKMLALSFLLLVGFVLVAESFHVAVPKGYIYFAMAFSVGVEMLNLRMKKRRKNKAPAVKLHQKFN